MSDEETGEFRFGHARRGRVELDFHVTYLQYELERALDPGPKASPTIRSGDDEMCQRVQARDAIAIAEKIESAISAVASGVEVRATAHIEGAAAGGPGVEGEILRFLVGDDPVGRVADILGILGAILATKTWIASHQTEEPEVSDGVAVLIAADALSETHDIKDVTVHYCTPINDVEDDYDVIGFQVGLRTGTQLFEVTVGRLGTVAGIHEVPIDRLDRGSRPTVAG